MEGDNPTRFFESWLPKTLRIALKSDRIKLERAHGSLAPKPPSTQRPRPILVRFHNFQDKQRVLNAAWELGIGGSHLKFGDSTVMFYQDFSVSVLRKHRMFDEVKRRLKPLYPALLKVNFRGSVKVFHEPATVKAFLSSVDAESVDNT